MHHTAYGGGGGGVEKPTREDARDSSSWGVPAWPCETTRDEGGILDHQLLKEIKRGSRDALFRFSLG